MLLHDLPVVGGHGKSEFFAVWQRWWSTALEHITGGLKHRLKIICTVNCSNVENWSRTITTLFIVCIALERFMEGFLED